MVAGTAAGFSGEVQTKSPDDLLHGLLAEMHSIEWDEGVVG